jgi:hypothetical protein
MSSELTPYEKSILQRVIDRRNAVPEEPEQEEPQAESNGTINPHRTNPNFSFSIDDLINRGNDDFYSDDKDANDRYIGVPISLQKTLDYVGQDGVVASMPYLIGGMSVAPSNNFLRQRWHTALTEENAGIDTKGILRRGKPIVIAVHGGGILTPERIKKAYNEGLTPQNAAKFTESEWSDLLEGKLPDGESIQIYSVDDVKNGRISEPFGRYGVVLDLEDAKATSSGYQNKNDFMKNQLVLARAGTLEHLETYFDNIQSGNSVSNWHRFGEIDPATPQGRVLFLNNVNYGLGSNIYLGNNGRFVGVVAPEAQGQSPRSGTRN